MRAGWLVALGTAWLAGMACGGDDDSRSYPVDLADDDHDLSAMQLTEADMWPIEARDGDELVLILNDAFSNEEWAGAFAAQNQDADPAQKQSQVEAQGRVDGYFGLFAWEEPLAHLGHTQEVQSHTTLYEDVEAASDAIAQRACGIFLGDDRPLSALEVPGMADESAAFEHEMAQDPLGNFVDTVVCFRTGRVVHAVVQNGLDGTDDLESALAMAQRKLEYVNAAYDGDDPPPADDGAES